MGKPKEQNQCKDTEKACKYTGGNTGKDSLPVLFQHSKLIIQRNCQSNSSRCQQVAQIFGAFIIGIIINMTQQQYTNSDHDGDQQRVENTEMKALL